MATTIIKDMSGDRLSLNSRTDHATVAAVISTSGGNAVYLTPEDVKTLQEALSEAVRDFEEAHRVLTTPEQIKALEPGVMFTLTHKRLTSSSNRDWMRVSGGMVSITGGAHYYDEADEEYNQDGYSGWTKEYDFEVGGKVS